MRQLIERLSHPHALISVGAILVSCLLSCDATLAPGASTSAATGWTCPGPGDARFCGECWEERTGAVLGQLGVNRPMDGFGVPIFGDFDCDGDQDLAVLAAADEIEPGVEAGRVFLFLRDGEGYAPWRTLPEPALVEAVDGTYPFHAPVVAQGRGA